MTRSGVVALSLLFMAGIVVAGAWDLPSLEPIELFVAITMSDRAYNVVLSSDVAKDAGGPEHAKLDLKKHEVRSLDRCRELIAAGEFAKADKILGAQMRKNRGNHDASALRALAKLRLGESEAALTYLRSSLIGNRRNPEAWKLLDEIAAKLGRKVVRPKLVPKGWVRPPDAKDEVEISHADADDEKDMPWFYYAVARAYYRHEGPFKKDFPKAKEYRFTFREQLYALGAAVKGADGGEEGVTAELERLLAERKAGTIVPFAFFAIYPEPIPAKPEPDFDELRPILEKYFDAHILVAGD